MAAHREPNPEFLVQWHNAGTGAASHNHMARIRLLPRAPKLLSVPLLSRSPRFPTPARTESSVRPWQRGVLQLCNRNSSRRDGRAFFRAAAARGRLPASFTATLAQLHTLDWRAAGFGFLGELPQGRAFAQRGIAKWRELIAESAQPPEPTLTELIAWLETNAPATERVCLVHGAYRTANLLIDDDRVAAVLDWELQVLGDPMYDIACVLSDLNREGTALLSNLVDRDAIVRDYESATGFVVDEAVWRYYNALYAMRPVAFRMSASGLYADGRSNDIRLARTAWSVPDVLQRAARELGY